MTAAGFAVPLIRTSIEGGLLILLVAAITRLAPRLPAAARCALWWLASLRLVLGLAFGPGLSAALPALRVTLPAMPASLAASGPVAKIPIDRITRALLAPPAGSQPVEAGRAAAVTPGASVSAAATAGTGFARLDPWTIVFLALLALWIAGILATLALHVRDTRRLARLWRAATPVDSSQVRGWLGTWIEDARAGRIELRASAELGSPLVMGSLTPRILIPSACLALDAAGLRMALAHEVSHVRRRDLWWGWVPALAESVFWFHPLAHWCVHEYAQAREEACDAEALRLSQASPDRYGEMLLGFGVDGARRVHAATSCGSSHVRQLKRRLHMLAHAVGSSRAQRALAIGAVLVIGAIAIVPIRFASGASSPRVRESESSSDSRSSSTHRGTTTSTTTSTRDGKVLYSIRSSRPAGSSESSNSYSWSSGGDGDEDHFSYGIMRGDHSSMSGTFNDNDWRWLKRLQEESDGELGWFSIDGRNYVVKDEDDIAAMAEILRPQMELGEQQGKLGARQGRLGDEQGKLGTRQGELGSRQGEISQQIAELEVRIASSSRGSGERAELRRRRDELESQIDLLSDEQSALSREQSRLGEQQAELGKLQSELGRKQEMVSRQTRRDMIELAERLIKDDRAERVER